MSKAITDFAALPQSNRLATFAGATKALDNFVANIIVINVRIFCCKLSRLVFVLYTYVFELKYMIVWTLFIVQVFLSY